MFGSAKAHTAADTTDDDHLLLSKEKRGRPPKSIIKPVELFRAVVLPPAPNPHPLQPLPLHLPPPIIPTSVKDNKQDDRISQLVKKAAVLEKELKVRKNFEDASSKKEDRLFNMFFKMVDKGAELSMKSTSSVISINCLYSFLCYINKGIVIIFYFTTVVSTNYFHQ